MPTPRVPNRQDWFKEAKFGMMIHWGLYALPAGEWKGRRMADIGEWLQLALESGMKYMVMTSKHADGFAMFHLEEILRNEVRRIKKHLNTRGINYLLNVGPDYLGRIPAPSAKILRDVANG